MDTPQDLTEVEALLDERDALHGWIERLDAAGTSTSPSVRSRVRDDYQRRIGEVTDRLRTHADAIANKLAEDREEHHELQAGATQARDALAEAELRFAVGEYDQARFEGERTSHASDVETYDVALGAVAERIARLEEVHALVTRPAAAGAAPSGAPVFETHADSADSVGEESPDDDDVAADAEPPAIGIGELALDDTDELLAIFDEADSAARGDEPGPLSFRPSASSMPDHDAMRAAPAPRFARPTEATRPPEDVTPSESDRDAVATDPVPLVSRSTRCGECGAMNLPMEWYCEKCGAELTAI